MPNQETQAEQPMAVCSCEQQDEDDELYAKVPDDGTGRSLVVIRRNGDVTNRYASGVVGVTEGDRTMAEQDEEPYCPNCGSYIEKWNHPT